jgi:Uma2 family endonuclease
MIPHPSSTSTQDRLVTGDELLEMGDIGPCELVDGRIVPMSPTGHEHGHLEVRLGGRLDAFVSGRTLGWVSCGEVGIYTRRNPDRVRGADIVFVSRERLSDRPGKKFLAVAPDLVVEIISPEDRWQDVQQKIEEYFAIGVSHVWIVQPENSAVLVYRSVTTITRLGAGDVLKGDGLLVGFALPLDELFE